MTETFYATQQVRVLPGQESPRGQIGNLGVRFENSCDAGDDKSAR